MTIDSERGVGELPEVHEAWLPREHSLHRPRHGGRQRLALVCAVVFFLGPAVMWVAGMRPAPIENHELAHFPSASQGWGFFTNMGRWSTDNLVFRTQAVQVDDWISRNVFGEPAPFDQGGSIPAGPLPGSPSDDPRTQPEQPGGPAGGVDRSGFRRVIEGTDGWLYLGDDLIAKCKPQKPFDETIQQLNLFRQAVEGSGRPFLLVVVPDKTTMVPEHLPESYPGKDCASSASPVVWRKLITLAGAMDLRPALQSAADRLGRPVYFPQDTHWTYDGALQMVRVLAERIQPGVSRPWRIEPYSKPTTSTADLPPLIGRKSENSTVRYRFMPDGSTDLARPSVNDLRAPVHHTSAPLEGMVDKRTLVLGDSFALPASSYLPGAFADVTQLHYTTIASNPQLVAATVADAEVVVLEIIERNVAGGIAQVLDPQFIESLRQELVKRPLR